MVQYMVIWLYICLHGYMAIWLFCYTVIWLYGNLVYSYRECAY